MVSLVKDLHTLDAQLAQMRAWRYRVQRAWGAREASTGAVSLRKG